MDMLNRFFNNKAEVDAVKIALESRLSFEVTSVEKELVRRALSSGNHAPLDVFLQEVLLCREDVPIAVEKELKLLDAYLGLCKLSYGEDFFLQYNVKWSEVADREIYPLIVFPLIVNAINNGYNVMEKYPVKIRLSVSDGGLILEVSNRVNHYLQNQGDTDVLQWYKSRLRQLYPGKHDVFTNSNSQTFKATLYLKF